MEFITDEGRLKYTDSHEWVAIEGEIGVVGISTHAQKELGEVVFIQLPKVGEKVDAGCEIAVLESTKAAADIYCPISGTIVAVNERVKDDPSILNSSPEREGWLFKIAVSDLSELDTLLDHQQYLQLTS
ncbi:MAG: Glycine cleavage system H protein [Chlamydiae bacterium]|nr:Glycine cleavage system H protein [Chlamydiota bacterium]